MLSAFSQTHLAQGLKVYYKQWQRAQGSHSQGRKSSPSSQTGAAPESPEKAPNEATWEGREEVLILFYLQGHLSKAPSGCLEEPVGSISTHGFIFLNVG